MRCCSLSTVLVVVVVASHVDRLTASDEDMNTAAGAGPFSARSRAAGNVLQVGGYMTALERQYRRLTRTRVDVMLRKLGDDFNAELTSVEPPLNRTPTTVSASSSLSVSLRQRMSQNILRNILAYRTHVEDTTSL